MFQTEHGPSGFDGPEGGDEINMVEKGRITVGPLFIAKTRAGLESPVVEYTPACAPASGMFYRGSAFPKFKGTFWVVCAARCLCEWCLTAGALLAGRAC